MELLNTALNSDLTLWGLFLSSLLGATLLPGGSELVLVGVLKLHPELFWPALLLGTLGNTLGGMISFGMGWILPQTQQLKHVERVQLQRGGAKHSGAGEAAEHSNPPSDKLTRNVMRVQRYGTPALLFAWAPLIGDALCIAAGWLRLNPLYAALFMLIGKFARYALVAYTVS